MGITEHLGEVSYHVDGGERQVEGEVKRLLIARLAMCEPGLPLSRPVEKLDL